MIEFVKGHGTENDFVLLPDLDDALDLRPDLVRAICDRRAGIGADGVLRVVPDRSGPAVWYMDYRNADGSPAGMCGNGARVFARYLVDAGLAEPGTFPIGTPSGTRTVTVAEEITVDMGAPEPLDARPTVAGRPGYAVSMGNPHVVVRLDTPTELAALDLRDPPAVTPPLPDGQNVEFVVPDGPRGLTARIHERGVGETKACGTGVCAAVVATVVATGTGRGEPWAVDVPGGRLTVIWTESGPVTLTGPAVLVGHGTLREDWLAARR